MNYTKQTKQRKTTRWLLTLRKNTCARKEKSAWSVARLDSCSPRQMVGQGMWVVGGTWWDRVCEWLGDMVGRGVWVIGRYGGTEYVDDWGT